MFSRTLTDKGLQFPAPRRFSFVVLVPRWLCSFLAPLKVERRTQMHRFHCLDSGGQVRSCVCSNGLLQNRLLQARRQRAPWERKGAGVNAFPGSLAPHCGAG